MATAVSAAGLIGLLLNNALGMTAGAVWEAWLVFFIGGVFALLTGTAATVASWVRRQTLRSAGAGALGYCVAVTIVLSISTTF